MFINNICSPAVIYLGFSITQIIIDIYKSMYNTAFLKFIISIIFTIILNIICERGLSIISWIIVFVPFIFITLITSILLYMFGLDPFYGKLKYNIDNLDENNNINLNSINNNDLYNTNINRNSLNNNYNENSLNNSNYLNNENTHKSDLPINRILNRNKNKNNNDYNNDNNNIINEKCSTSCLNICNNKNISNFNNCLYDCKNYCKKNLYNTIN
jgi:c-di-AMP phosphodiesterase-like protein